MYGSLFFIGIILSILFIAAAALIIYYKQLSEGYEDQNRFDIMQKVGMTDDIEQRLQVYRSHNPFICFNNTFLPCGGNGMKQMESNCSMFIKRYARNNVRAAGEWTIVSEEDYLMLCDMFSNHDTFCAIAEGLK